jgi:hypothetical protein
MADNPPPCSLLISLEMCQLGRAASHKCSPGSFSCWRSQNQKKPSDKTFFDMHTRTSQTSSELTVDNGKGTEGRDMKVNEKENQKGATGYILLWLLGIPIPVLLLIFLLRGCT